MLEFEKVADLFFFIFLALDRRDKRQRDHHARQGASPN